MNQHYDPDSDGISDEFEKRLAAISLLSPSEEFTTIPDRLTSVEATNKWGNWRWLGAASLLGCLLIALLLRPNNQSPPGDQGTESLLAEIESAAPDSTQNPAATADSNPQVFLAGTHYAELANPVEMSDSIGTQVLAFFWYPCGGCYRFEPILSDWEKDLEEDVTLTRVPAIWSEAMRFHAHAYFTAQTLGVLDQAHEQFYIEFQKEDPIISNDEELQLFFNSIGVAPDEFMQAHYGEATLENLRQAERDNFAYQIQSTPSMFVSGQYGISPSGAGGLAEMLEVADYLIDTVERCRTNPTLC